MPLDFVGGVDMPIGEMRHRKCGGMPHKAGPAMGRGVGPLGLAGARLGLASSAHGNSTRGATCTLRKTLSIRGSSQGERVCPFPYSFR